MNFAWSAWILICFAAINNSVAAILLKRSRYEAPDAGLMSLLLSPWLIGALIFYATNVVLFAKALDKLPVSTVYPVYAGLAFGLVAISGSYFFGERLGFGQYIGLGIILTGIIVTSRS